MQKVRHPEKWRLALVVVVTLLAAGLIGTGVFFALRQELGGLCAAECPEPLVDVESGTLRGECRPASSKGVPQYAAFLGIPYAKPPLGELRFKAPRPVQSWGGVRSAQLFGQRCLQGGVDTQEGAEDCLHVNVYSAELYHAKQQPVPVLVHVHGGAMKQGTGNIIRPDYFVARGLVVVTFNYRLGHYGFLNLDSDLAPGNAGLKDMVAALQWVRRNIHVFGGDPDQVTVQGCSSAAAAVHWLCLLPQTEGLFQRAIVKSGSALLSWAFTDRHRDFGDRAVDFLRRWWPNTTDADLLAQRSTLELELAFSYADKHRLKDTPETSQAPTVSVELRPDGEEPKLILKDAESYLLEPARSRVPMILGITNCEYNGFGDMFFMSDELPPPESPLLTVMMQRSIIPTSFARTALALRDYSHTFDQVADDVRGTLFNLSAVDTACNIVCRWETYFSASYIKVDTIRAARLHARQDKAPPVYTYYFEYPMMGTCALHAQDDKKMWPESEVDVMPLNATDSLALNVLRQVTLFSNFVKFGKPVPQTDAEVLTSEWAPMVKDEADNFLRIGVNLTLDKGDLLGPFGPFWKGLYEKYRDWKGI